MTALHRHLCKRGKVVLIMLTGALTCHQELTKFYATGPIWKLVKFQRAYMPSFVIFETISSLHYLHYVDSYGLWWQEGEGAGIPTPFYVKDEHLLH